MGKWLAKFENNPEMPKRRTDKTDIARAKREPAQVVSLQEEAIKRGRPFPYPLPETCGIGEWDPMDIRWINGKPVLEPGWWRNIPRGKG
jgi:hypothetical protein